MAPAMMRFILSLFIIAIFSNTQAQKLTGIWRGYFITESGEQYRLEFQVQQSKSLSVTGVSYSYLDKRFYGKARMTGNFALKGKSFVIQETRTTEVRNLGGGGTCLMNYKFLYSKSGPEEFLEGTYVGKTENRLDPKKNGVWGDCGGGKVYLRRVETSDFYVEPFLREQPIAKKAAPPSSKKGNVNSPIVKAPPSKTATNPAKKNPPTATTKVPPVEKNAPPVKKTTSLPPPPAESTPPPQVKVDPSKKLVIPAQTRSRQNELIKTLDVEHPQITLRIYDNGEIDDDTVSVYLNNELVLSKKRLSTTPLSLNITLNEESPEQVLVMVAENLGRIPPNTSLMLVTDGDKRYEVRITSTEQKNAMIRFRYQKKAP
jgi:hypothetical protein